MIGFKMPIERGKEGDGLKSKEKVIKSYIRRVRRCFPAYGKYERVYLSRLKENLIEFSERMESFHEEDIIREFGRPTEIAADYFSSVEEEYLQKRLRIAHYIRVVCTAAVVVILLYTTYISYSAYCEFQEALKANIVYEETIIEEGED